MLHYILLHNSDSLLIHYFDTILPLISCYYHIFEAKYSQGFQVERHCLYHDNSRRLQLSGSWRGSIVFHCAIHGEKIHSLLSPVQGRDPGCRYSPAGSTTSIQEIINIHFILMLEISKLSFKWQTTNLLSRYIL